MNIKTWKERWRNPWLYKRDAMQAEIDELRAENAAQRKVLEQALEAMQKIKRIEGAAWEGGSHIVAARAITAIQEQLNGQD